MKISPVGTKLFHGEERTERHDEDNSSFFRNLLNVPKNQPVSAVQ